MWRSRSWSRPLGGLAAALLLNAVKTGRRWLLAATVLPWALPPVINAIVWLWIYNPSYGLLNGVLKARGAIAANHVWFNDRATALVLIGLVHVWRMMPLTAVILLSALQGVPADLIEAARLDGAGPVQRFRFVTLPLISGGLAIALSQSTVFAFNLFDEAWILNGIEPRHPHHRGGGLYGGVPEPAFLLRHGAVGAGDAGVAPRVARLRAAGLPRDEVRLMARSLSGRLGLGLGVAVLLLWSLGPDLLVARHELHAADRSPVGLAASRSARRSRSSITRTCSAPRAPTRARPRSRSGRSSAGRSSTRS